MKATAKKDLGCRLGLHLWGVTPDPDLVFRAQCQRCGTPDVILQAAIDQKLEEAAREQPPPP